MNILHALVLALALLASGWWIGEGLTDVADSTRELAYATHCSGQFSIVGLSGAGAAERDRCTDALARLGARPAADAR